MKKGYVPLLRTCVFLISLFIVPFFSSDLLGNTLMRRELEKIWEDTQLRLGPFYVNTVFFLNHAGFDSNVYRTTHDPVKDFTFSTGPAVSIYLPIKKRIVFSLYESPQYMYFKETKRERSWNQYFDVGVHFFLNRFQTHSTILFP